jgi:hypothetical protein
VAKGIADASPFAFDTPVSRGLLAPCLLMFVYTLVIEIIDTVTFIIDYYDSLRIDEIIYISAKYVFILILFFLSMVVARAVKNLFINKNKGENV